MASKFLSHTSQFTPASPKTVPRRPCTSCSIAAKPEQRVFVRPCSAGATIGITQDENHGCEKNRNSDRGHALRQLRGTGRESPECRRRRHSDRQFRKRKSLYRVRP